MAMVSLAWTIAIAGIAAFIGAGGGVLLGRYLLGYVLRRKFMKAFGAAVAVAPAPDPAAARELLAELEAKHGRITEDELAKVRKEWPPG
jgi:hypothetical protein